MLTYQIRHRVVRVIDGEDPLTFPAEDEIRFYFEPLQAFGLQAGGGRTVVQGQAPSTFWNSNTGEYWFENRTGLDPLEVVIEWPDARCELRGNVLTWKRSFHSFEDLAENLENIHHAYPAMLNIYFADPPRVVRVDGIIANRSFRWELSKWKINGNVTTQERQQTCAGEAFLRMELLTEPRRRILAAIHYFYIACRLNRCAQLAGEFIGETILNLARTLEVLFSSSRNEVRQQLRSLGYSETEVEGKFIPAILLRNQVDSGHARLGLFTMEQLEVIHSYADQAEGFFRELLTRIIERTNSGSYEPRPYTAAPVDVETARTISGLRERLATLVR